MGNELILSVDIGTGATKAVLFDAKLQQKAIGRAFYSIFAPQRGWSEQDPEEIFLGVQLAIDGALKTIPKGDHLAGIVFSSQMYSVLAVDPNGTPLTRSLTWSDTRSAAIAQEFRQNPHINRIFQKTGCPIDAIYPLSKIKWLQQTFDLPSNSRFISIKEYVIFRLTGLFLVDWSIASSSGLMDIRQHTWDPDALSLTGLKPDQLSELTSPRFIIKDWLIKDSAIGSIPPGTPLIIGAGDGPLASLGVGALASHTLAVNVGTSTAARCIVQHPIVDSNGRLWTYVLDEGYWVIGGISSSGGIVYDWFLKQFCSSPIHSETNSLEAERSAIEKLAADAPPAADGLIFIPYLGGEQCPDWQPYTRGNFSGLDFMHTRGHLARAVLEGITRSIFRIAQTIQEEQGSTFKEARVTGGMAASSIWLQIAADMFGIPVVAPDSSEGSARGAAIIGWNALGCYISLEDFDPKSLPAKKIEPRQDIHSVYQEQYQHFLEILKSARSTRM